MWDSHSAPSGLQNRVLPAATPCNALLYVLVAMSESEQFRGNLDRTIMAHHLASWLGESGASQPEEPWFAESRPPTIRAVPTDATKLTAAQANAPHSIPDETEALATAGRIDN